MRAGTTCMRRGRWALPICWRGTRQWETCLSSCSRRKKRDGEPRPSSRAARSTARARSSVVMSIVASLLDRSLPTKAHLPHPRTRSRSSWSGRARTQRVHTSRPIRSSAWARRAATSLLGESRVVPLGFLNLAGEDFAHYLERIPGCFLRIGAREAGGAPIPAHAPKFYAAEESIFVGAAVLAEAARVASDALSVER